MLKVLIGVSELHPLNSLVGALTSHSSVEVVDVCATGRGAVDSLRHENLDAIVFPSDWAETCRAIRLSAERDIVPSPSFIVASTPVRTPLRVKALLYGFNGAIDSEHEVSTAYENISSIVEGRNSLLDESLLNNLRISHGLLAHELIVDNQEDREISDLVGAGLPDADIATLMGLSIQHVRNRIGHLLQTNKLTYRTQLAVLSASVWRVPDFE